MPQVAEARSPFSDVTIELICTGQTPLRQTITREPAASERATPPTTNTPRETFRDASRFGCMKARLLLLEGSLLLFDVGRAERVAREKLVFRCLTGAADSR
jgi:hypothetical protein